MKKVFNFINVSKVYAVMTAICFIISTLGANIQASINDSASTDIYSHIFDNLNAIKQENGKITSVRDLSSDVTVINIQDLHCHLQTQKNISELINEIDKNYLLKSVFIEGGYGNIETAWVNQIKDENFKNKVIEQLLKDGYLTGAEYYAIKNKKENLLKGIDEEKIHLSNLSRLAKIMEKESLYTDVISKVNQEISILNNYYINEQNKRFSRSLEKYKAGKINNIKFYKILFKYAEKINNNLEKYNNIIPINTGYYPNINTYINISKQSTEINTRLVGVQLQQLITLLKNEMSYNSYKKLLAVTNNFNDTEKLVDFVTIFSKEKNFDISKNFNELDKFIQIKNSNKKFNPVELLNEERILIDQIRMALSYDNTEYEIAYITDFQEYFKNYLQYSLNAQDWQYFKQGFAKFKYLYSKYAVIDRIKTIENDFSEIDKYYDVNSDRNNIFIANILNSIDKPLETKQIQQRTAEEILKQSKDIIIVITGGYHSLDLQNILDTKNINSIVITPNITDNVSHANKKYEDIIKEQNKLLSQALAFKLASSSSDIEQKTLLTKVAVELLGKNNLNQLNDLLNEKINIYKDDKGNTIVNYIDDKIEIKLNQQINKSLQAKQDNVKNILNVSIQQISDIIPTAGLKSIFTPDTYQIMKEISLKLFNLDIYFSNGHVFEIVNSQYNNKDIDGISPEIYSTFLPEIQKMLLKQQNDTNNNQLSIIDSNIKIVRAIGEELIFRTIPSIITILIPVIGLPSFIISQIVFLFSHLITKWIHTSDSNTKITISLLIKSVFKLITNSQYRNQFIDFAKQDEQKQYIKNLSLPAIGLTTPYITAILISLINPFMMPFATVISLFIASIFHYIYNINANLEKQLNLTEDTSNIKSRFTFKRFTDVAKMSSNYDIKLPQSLIEVLEVKEGESLFITYIKNNQLQITKTSEELKLLVNAIAENMPNKNFSTKRKVERIIYPNTYEIKIKKDGIVNLTLLYRYKIDKHPLTQEELDNVNITFTKISLKDKEKSKPSINDYLSYDNSEEAVSPSYVDDNILIPTIDNLLRCILYKNSFDFITKLLVFLINIFEEEKHYPYFDILKNSNNKVELKSIASNTNVELKYRLFALMYLKKNGFYINDSITSDIRERFIIDVKDGRFKVKNNFDLRALTTGVFLSLDYFTNDLIKNKDKQIIYGRISKALIVKKGKKRTTANAAMFFVAYDPLTIAHELGHNILFDLGFHTSNGAELTIHELFADVVANIFGNIISDYKIDQNAVLYDLFNESFDYNYVFQEEHSAARGFINLLLNTSYSINEHMRWEKLANIIINYVSKKKKIKEKQAEVFHDISQQYFNTIINSQIYPKTNNMAEIEKILLTESCYTVVNDILLEVKEISQKRYSIIIDKIKQSIVMPKSYRYAKKSKLDYDNDSVIINNIILSQPRKIYDVLKIIKSEILQKFYFNKSEMEILVSIDILLKSDINDTSRNAFITQLKKYIRYIPNKKACDMDDYRRLEKYINGYEYPVLTMTWLNKLLLSMGKIDFNDRQQIITAVEYPIIVLGMFFPKIRNWFIKRHKTVVYDKVDENLKDLEKVTENGIIKITGNSVEEIKSLSLINKLIVISKIIANKTIKKTNVAYHTALNIESDNFKHIFIQFMPYQDDLLTTTMKDNDKKQNKVSIYIANDIEQFKGQYKLINTGLTVDGQNIWQININDNLVYAASGVDTLKIVKTINNSRLIKNNLNKILNLNDDINLNIDASVFVDTESDGIYFDDGIIITNTNFYIKSITEIFKSISMMYAQKTIISLDNIQNEKLYQALTNGNVRKTITLRQFEYLKELFKQENKNISEEIIQLRKKGIEIYIKSEEINNIYADYGISGQIIGNTIYDYYLNETTELEVIESKMAIKDLENKMINSEKPLLIGIDILQEIFRANRDITDAYNGFSSLLGNIKIKFGLQNINTRDMANFAYSINITNIPITNENTKNTMMDSNINDFTNIMNLDKNNVISIILNDTKINDDMKNIFLTVIKERILVKTKLLEQDKENGLKDKKLEILLGKVLLLQLANTDKSSLLPELDTFKGNEQDMIAKVNKLYQKALTNNEPQVLNTIIELILVYSEEYKTKEKMKVNNIDIIAYRQMLAAA